MTDLAGRIDRDAIADLTVGQWDDAPRLQALLDGLLGLLQTRQVDPLAGLEDAQSLDRASGVWLDRIGQRLGLDRPSVADATFTRFGFEGSDGVGFDQAPFHSSIPALTARVPLGDQYYDCFLGLQALGLRSSGSVPDLEAMLRSEFPTAYIQDHADGSLTVRNVANDPRQNLADLADPIIRAFMPAGVEVTIEDP